MVVERKIEMTQPTLLPNWKAKIIYSSAGPRPQIIMDTEKAKVLLIGLEPGVKIPSHPEGQGVFHFLEGTGWITVNGELLNVQAGATVMVPEGATRGIEAETRLAFLVVKVM